MHPSTPRTLPGISSTTGNTGLRVVSVSDGPDGPSFTLDGTLYTVSDLVKAVLTSPDLLAVLDPSQVRVAA